MLQEKIAPFQQQNQSNISESFPVSVINMRPNPKSGGSVLAYADVRVGPVTILGVSIVKNKNGGEFVALPSRSGGSKWFPVVEVDEPVKQQIIKSVLEVWTCSHV